MQSMTEQITNQKEPSSQSAYGKAQPHADNMSQVNQLRESDDFENSRNQGEPEANPSQPK